MGPLRMLAGLLVLCQCLAGCSARGPAAPELGDDLSRASLAEAVVQSLRFLVRAPDERVLGRWPRRLTVSDLRSSLLEFQKILATAPERWLEQVAEQFEFYPAPVSASGDEPLFTGYYQPVLDARLIATSDYCYPLYAPPPGEAANLSRRDIDGLGKLAGGGHEIAWLKDPVDRFFLHIQGSGLLQLQDGRHRYVNFAASNGRPYTSIGKVLIEAGQLDAHSLSMQRIRSYLAAHPGRMDELLERNERYVFFHLADDGPLGSLGVPLTAGRSIATDATVYPKGGVAFIDTELPVVDEAGNVIAWRPTRRFVINQDTGAAIRGPDRVDLYFGSGARAGAAAGVMKTRGRLYFLLKKLPNEATLPVPPTRSEHHRAP